MSNPYLTGFPFGIGNFPTGANPWSGQTAAVSDGLAFYTPGNVLQAEGLNYRFNQTQNAILYNANYAASLDVMNWPSGLKTFSTVTLPFMHFDPVYGRWVGMLGGGGQLHVAYDPAFATNASLGGALTGSANGMGVRATTGEIFAVEVPVGKIAIFSPTSGAWTESAGTIGAYNGTTGAASYISGVVFFNNQWVFFGLQLPGVAMLAYYSPAAGTTFSAGTGTLPLAFDTIPIYAASSSLLCVFSHADGTHYATTADGQTWTQRALPTLSGGEVPVGAGYSTVDGMFWLCTSNTGTTHFWQSASGTGSWTSIASTSTTTQSFVSRDHTWAIIANGAAGTASAYRLCISTDLGADWYIPALAPLASTGYLRATAVGFIYADGTNAAASLAAGYPSRASL